MSSVAREQVIYSLTKYGDTLQKNCSLVTNFSDQKLLVTIITNLDTSLQNKKNHWLLK